MSASIRTGYLFYTLMVQVKSNVQAHNAQLRIYTYKTPGPVSHGR